MAFCANCGSQVPDGKKFCVGCGAPMEASGGQAPPPVYQQPYQQPYQQQVAPASAGASTATQDFSGEFDPTDIEKNKTMAGLAYILFFLPLVACPESRFGRFHANQGLVLLLFSVGGSIILSIIPLIGWLILLFYPFAILAFAIIGLLNGLKGLAKELPLIGKIKLIK